MNIRRSKPLYAWYGDDFTGSTDVLESFALHGVPAVLFTHPPSARELAAFPDARAIGIAGESRSFDPKWMAENLPAVFTRMKRLRSPINHYKVCSTFDSSPETGSIGKAIELGRKSFAAEFVPIVVGAPHLGRSVVFGNLFATEDGVVYRIDRHPTMQRHPVTPMQEADLRLHLARQTAVKIGLVDHASFQAGTAAERLQAEVDSGAKAILFDGLEPEMLTETAALLWNRALERSVFAVGSSGLTYGLMRHWSRLGLIDDPPQLERPAKADRLIVVSGSCSPVTAGQIRHARQQGFASWLLKDGEPWMPEIHHALEALAKGQSVVLYTSLGSRTIGQENGNALGEALGEGLRELLTASGVRRVLVAGGDTSAHAVKKLDLDALTFAAPLVPGAPLCRAHAPGSPMDGLELALKGGQIGPEDFFAQVRDGG